MGETSEERRNRMTSTDHAARVFRMRFEGCNLQVSFSKGSDGKQLCTAEAIDADSGDKITDADGPTFHAAVVDLITEMEILEQFDDQLEELRNR